MITKESVINKVKLNFINSFNNKKIELISNLSDEEIWYLSDNLKERLKEIENYSELEFKELLLLENGIVDRV